MVKTVLVVDYNAPRRQQLVRLLRARFPEWEVSELETSEHTPTQDLDADKLALVNRRKYDLLVGHIGGNPSGYECLKVFKRKNRKGRAVLYTKRSQIPIDEFQGLKLADEIFERSADDNKLFDDADRMLDIIEKVMHRPSVNISASVFQEPPILAAMAGAVIAGVLGIIAALLK